jgi:prepilin-type N-terminal cleavage/methylation domain-containing protein
MNSRRAVVFALIEMLIAIAILGLLLIALYATRQNVWSRTSRDVRLTKGEFFVRSILTSTKWSRIEGSTSADWSGIKAEPGERKIANKWC